MLEENFVFSLVEMLQNGYICVILNVRRFVHHACFRIYIEQMPIVDTFTLVEENFVISLVEMLQNGCV